MITVLDYTKEPLFSIGRAAGLCYNTTNPKAFERIAKSCIESGHDRTAEFADLTIEISGYSAKMIRELYTHIIGTSRLSASTRYIDYTDFGMVIPKEVLANEEALAIWEAHRQSTINRMQMLDNLGIKKEDYANLLPLAYEQKMVLKINVRALIHLFEVRTCTRAYHEFRDFMKELKEIIINNCDEQWQWIVNNTFKTKCDVLGYCPESKKFTCGRYPVK
jgi:thymidylate synthase (FAD)